jgi:putative nucleotidyltransferase with HDIG domain
MTRILLVDDEPLILKGLKLRLRHDDELQVFTADGVVPALRILEREPIDVVLTDIRMPETDGIALLAEVHDRWPSVIRMVMSGHLDRGAWLHAVPLAQAVLHKPCSGREVRAHLLRAAAVQDRFQDPRVLEVLDAVDGLPAAPALYQRLGEMAGDSRVGLAQVAQAVESDPAIAAQVLRVANSAWLGLRRQVADVREALNFLGIDLVRKLTLSVELYSNLGPLAAAAGVDARALQHRAALTARLAASLVSAPDRSVATTAALLHDVGVLALASARPEQWRASRERIRAGMHPLDAENEVFGCTHATAGAILLNRWGLPLQIVDAVAFHEDARRSAAKGLDLAGAVYVASRLVQAAQLGQLWAPRDPCATVDLGWLDARGLRDDLPRWRKLAETVVEEGV